MRRKDLEKEFVVYRLVDDGTEIRVVDTQVSCGRPTGCGQVTEEMVNIVKMLGGSSENLYIVDVQGESMQDFDIKPGDSLVVDGDKPPTDGAVVLARLNGEELVKQFHRDREGRVWLIPGNARFHPIMVNGGQELEIIGVVTRNIKNVCPEEIRTPMQMDQTCHRELRLLHVDDSSSQKFMALFVDREHAYQMMERMHELLDGAHGVKAFRTVRAIFEKHALNDYPSYRLLKEEFRNIGDDSAYYRVKGERMDEKVYAPIFALLNNF